LCETKIIFSNSRKNNLRKNYYKVTAKEITSSPNDDVAVAVAGEDVAVLIEGDTGNVSGLIPALEDTHTFI